MANIVACYKWVRDEADIRIADDLSVDTTKAQWVVSEFDKSAIEAAVQLADAAGDSAVTLSYGGAAVAKSFKDALSRGPEQGYWVNAEGAEASDSRATAKALAAGVKSIDDVELVVCAEGASDTYARQVGPRLGAVLDWPVVTSVLSVSIDGNTVKATRKLEDTTQTVRVQLPAVVCVLPEGYEPRTPGLKDIMKAGKKPSTELSAADLGCDPAPLTHDRELKGFVAERKNIIVEGDSNEEIAQKLVSALRKEGVLA